MHNEKSKLEYDIESFIQQYRLERSHPSAPPNAIAFHEILNAICNHFHVHIFEDLLGIEPLQLPILRQMQIQISRLWTFVMSFVQSRCINTLHECQQMYLQEEGVEYFHDLQLGNSFLHTQAVQELYCCPMAIAPISTFDILNHLRRFGAMGASDAFREATHIDVGEFLHFLGQQYRLYNGAGSGGVYINPIGFGSYVKMLRRVVKCEMKELNLLEEQFRKGITEQVFELTKEKFSAENRKIALKQMLEQTASTSLKKSEEPNDQKQLKQRTSFVGSCLSIDILKRVTEVDVYLDNLLSQIAKQLNAVNSTSISSEAIAETDLRLRTQLTRFLMASQKSKLHSRIKVITWVVCGILAKMQNMLLHNDKIPQVTKKVDKHHEDSHTEDFIRLISEGNQADSDEECDCCCVGEEVCGCSCQCSCHADDSSEDDHLDKQIALNLKEVSPSPVPLQVSGVGTRNSPTTISSDKNTNNLSVASIKPVLLRCIDKRKEFLHGQGMSILEVTRLFTIIEHDVKKQLVMDGEVAFDMPIEESVWPCNISMLRIFNEMSFEGNWGKWIHRNENYMSLSKHLYDITNFEDSIKYFAIQMISMQAYSISSTSILKSPQKKNQLLDNKLKDSVVLAIVREFTMDVANQDSILYRYVEKLVGDITSEMVSSSASDIWQNHQLVYASVLNCSSAYKVSHNDTEFENEGEYEEQTNTLHLVEHAKKELASCPYLVDVASYLSWNCVYKRVCGSLGSFIREHEMISNDDHASSVRFLIFHNEQIIRVDGSATPISLSTIVENAILNVSDSGESPVALPSRDIAIQLFSIYVNYGGNGDGSGVKFPRELVQVQLQALMSAVFKYPARSYTLHRLVLEVLLQIPVEMVGYFYKLFEETFRNNLEISEHMSDVCRCELESIHLRNIGRKIGIDFFVSKPKPMYHVPQIKVQSVGTMNDSQQISTAILSTSNEEYNGQSLGEKNITPSDVATSKYDVSQCQEFIVRLRREQFGIGLDVSDSETLEILSRQRSRLERALKRLSDELYSENSHFVLELIQNADDNAYSSSVIPSCEFTLTKSANGMHPSILFSNNEVGFTVKNIQAICDVGASTKSQNTSNCIGKKGIGFKSVFKVSDEPEVHSNGFHIRFYASRPEISGGLGYVLPHWISNTSNWIDIPGTAFLLPLNERTIPYQTQLIHAIENYDATILLFLRKLQQIKISNCLSNKSDEQLILRKEKVETIKQHFVVTSNIKFQLQRVTLSSYGGVLGSNTTCLYQDWFIVKQYLDIPNSLVQHVNGKIISELIIALPFSSTNYKEKSTQETSIHFSRWPSEFDEFDAEDSYWKHRPALQKVYAYLPIRSYGFRFIVQADFSIPSSREALDNTCPWNQYLVTQLPILFGKAICEYLQQDDVSPLYAISLLPIASELEAPFKAVDREMCNQIRNVPCFPSLKIVHDSNTDEKWSISDLIDASDIPVTDLIAATHDVGGVDFIIEVFGKRFIHPSIPMQLPQIVKTQLRLEKFKASHILRMLQHFSTTQLRNANEENIKLARNITFVVSCFKMLTVLWKKNFIPKNGNNHESPIWVEELRLIKCFPIQLHEHNNLENMGTKITWRSLSQCQNSLYFPPLSGSKFWSKVTDSSVSWFPNLLSLDFTQIIEQHQETKKFLIKEAGLIEIDDHHLILQYVLPQIHEIGLQFQHQQTEEYKSYASDLVLSHYSFLIDHLYKCDQCPLFLSPNYLQTIRDKLFFVTIDGLLVHASEKNVYFIRKSSMESLPKLSNWVQNQLSPRHSLAIVTSQHCKEKVQEETWYRMLKYIHGPQDLFDFKPFSAWNILLSEVEQELNMATKKAISGEISKYVNNILYSDEVSFDKNLSTYQKVWQSHQWLVASDDQFHTSTSLWFPSETIHDIISPNVAPFTTFHWSSEKAIQLLSFRLSPTLEDVLEILCNLSSKSLGSQPRNISISEVSCLYKFIQVSVAGSSDLTIKVSDAFSKTELIWVEGSNDVDILTSKFVGIESVVWSSPVRQNSLFQLADIYPKSLRKFFIEVVGVLKSPTVDWLCQSLEALVASHKQDKTIATEDWMSQINPILHALMKLFSKNSNLRDIIHSKLINVKWMPSVLQNALVAPRVNPLIVRTKEERRIYKVLLKLHSLPLGVAFCPTIVTLANVDEDIILNLVACFKISSLSYHILQNPNTWLEYLISCISVASTITNSNGKMHAKAHRYVLKLMRILIGNWAIDYSQNPTKWDSKKLVSMNLSLNEMESFRWNLTNSQIFPASPITTQSTTTEKSMNWYSANQIFVNDQCSLPNDILNTCMVGSGTIYLLSLYPSYFFVPKTEVFRLDSTLDNTNTNNCLLDNVNILQFLLDICEINSLEQNLRNEVDFSANHTTASDGFHHQIRIATHLTERFIYYHYNQLYQSLQHDEMQRVIRQLECIVVNETLGEPVIQYSILGLPTVKFKVQMRKNSIFYDSRIRKLYFLVSGLDKESKYFRQVFLKILHSCFGKQIAANVANFVDLALQFHSEEEREVWLLKEQELPSLENSKWIGEHNADDRTKSAVDQSQVLRKRPHTDSVKNLKGNEEFKMEGYHHKRFCSYPLQNTLKSDLLPNEASDAPSMLSAKHTTSNGDRFYNPGISPMGYYSRDQKVTSNDINTFSSMTQMEREAVGRAGEKYVYQQLLNREDVRNGVIRVEWVNEVSESGLPYDIKLVNVKNKSNTVLEYVEVKSTRTREKGIFEISINELDYAATQGSNYVIYRVFNACNPSMTRVIKLKNPVALVRQKKLQLLLVME